MSYLLQQLFIFYSYNQTSIMKQILGKAKNDFLDKLSTYTVEFQGRRNNLKMSKVVFLTGGLSIKGIF